MLWKPNCDKIWHFRQQYWSTKVIYLLVYNQLFPKFFIMLMNLHRSGANRTCSPLQLLIKSWICWNIVVLSTSLVSWKKKVNNHFCITLSNCNFVSSLVLCSLVQGQKKIKRISPHSKCSQINVYLKNPSKPLKISVKSMVFPILSCFTYQY